MVTGRVNRLTQQRQQAPVSPGTSAAIAATVTAASSGLLTARVEVSSVELLDLLANPVELIGAPGAGKINHVVAGPVWIWTLVGSPYSGDSSQAVVAYDGAGVLIAQSGTDNDANLVFTNNPASEGYARNNLENKAVQLSGEIFVAGSIASASVSTSGLLYAPGDTGEVTSGQGDATYTVLTIGGGGEVLTFSIDTPGIGYVLGAGQATLVSTGAGDGAFTISVDSLSNESAGTLVIDMLYRVIDLP